MTPKRKTITVKRDGSSYQHTALIYGPLAVHKTRVETNHVLHIDHNNFTVTHVATGYAISKSFSHVDAHRFAQEAMDLDEWDFDDPKQIPHGLKESVRALLEEIWGE